MGTVRLIVKDLAERNGVLNANQLHEETGIRYETCYRIFKEDGESLRIDTRTLARLCDRFKVKPGDLFSYSANGKKAKRAKAGSSK